MLGIGLIWHQMHAMFVLALGQMVKNTCEYTWFVTNRLEAARLHVNSAKPQAAPAFMPD